ncbi:MAG: hypothetical protein MUP98_06330, partial [Candidatus Aminicenantes bacterium]|nr:hypothetical protein [Candidatus Aminicenantes bacterium]
WNIKADILKLLNIRGTFNALGKNFIIDHKNFRALNGDVIDQGMDIHNFTKNFVWFLIVSF